MFASGHFGFEVGSIIVIIEMFHWTTFATRQKAPHGASLIYLISLWKKGHHFADAIVNRIFMNEKFCTLIKILLKFVPKGIIANKGSIGSGNGLAPNWRQAITWTNADLVHRRINATLGAISSTHMVFRTWMNNNVNRRWKDGMY